MSELQTRRHKLMAELDRLAQESQQLAASPQQTVHWHEVIAHAERFRQLLGDNLDQLPFADRQAVAKCLIQKVVVTGEQVDISYVLPFEFAPQVWHSTTEQAEGTSEYFYRLRLADHRSLCRPQRLDSTH